MYSEHSQREVLESRIEYRVERLAKELSIESRLQYYTFVVRYQKERTATFQTLPSQIAFYGPQNMLRITEQGNDTTKSKHPPTLEEPTLDPIPCHP
ncbi:hypothetical protein VTH06DRAFT_6425 [Thermothelomyces fergusii]